MNSALNIISEPRTSTKYDFFHDKTVFFKQYTIDFFIFEIPLKIRYNASLSNLKHEYSI